MNNSYVQLGAAFFVLLVLIFVVACFGFSISEQSCGACRFIYNYQTLIAGILALSAAFIALVPVFEQVRMAKLQSAIMTREVLIKRLRNVAARRRIVANTVRSITSEFEAAIYPNPDGGEAEIGTEWAHAAAQTVSLVVSRLKVVQKSRSDPAEINSERQNLILLSEQLERCLYLIPIPVLAPWDDEEAEPTEAQRVAAMAEADKQAKAAQEELPLKIVAVRKAGKALDDAYLRLIEALRTQLRRIDDSVLAPSANWK